MLSRKSNRFFFFIAWYTAIFAVLAVFGTVESVHLHRQHQDAAAQRGMIAAITKNKSFYRLPRMDLMMPSVSGDDHHLRLGISLEMDQKNLDRFNDFQPRVSDRIISYLGRQDMSQLSTEGGIHALHNDILFEVNKASGPVLISDIVFREIVIR